MGEPDSSTLLDVLLRRAEAAGDQAATLHQRGETIVTTTWAEWVRRARTLAAGMIELGIGPGDRVAILSNTRAEWSWLETAATMAGAITVPIFPAEVADGCAHQLGDSGARLVVVEDPVQAAKVLATRGRLPGLETIYYLDRTAETGGGGRLRIEDLPGSAGALESIGELLDMGEAGLCDHVAELDRRIASLDPDSCATIQYTAGTEGTPKGVRLTHRALSLTSAAVARRLPLGPEDRQLLYLPLAQAFARLCLAVAVRVGFPTALARSHRTVLADCRTFRPTFLCGVPRLFQGIQRRVLRGEGELPGVQKAALRLALSVADGRAGGRAHRGIRGRLEGALADRLVLGPMAERFGGALRFAICGGASLHPDTGGFFRTRGVEILERYGSTETCACTHLNALEDNRLGSVGPPLDHVEVRLLEDGEITIRSRSVTPGYWTPEPTPMADEDGWLRTGDLGALDDGDFLTITDRKRDVIVTANGKAIAAQPIAATLEAEPLIDQVLIHGDQRDYLTALVALDPEALAAFVEDHGLQGECHADLSRHPAVHEVVEAAVTRVNASLPWHENIRKFAILPSVLSAEEGDITSTRRLRRKVASERHRALLDSFYSERY